MLVNPPSSSNSTGEKYRSQRLIVKAELPFKAKGDRVQFSAPALIKSLGLQGLTSDQIAYKMGLPVATVRSHLEVSFRF